MGIITIQGITDEELELINLKMQQLTNQSLEVHLDSFFNPWVKLIKKSNDKFNEDKLPPYIQRCKGKYRFDRYDSHVKKHVTFEGSYDEVLKFKEKFKKLNYEYDKVREVKDIVRGKKVGCNHVYFHSKKCVWRLQLRVNGKDRSFGQSKDRDLLLKLNDYLMWKGNLEDIYKVIQSNKKTRVVSLTNLMEEDGEYADYLRQKQSVNDS